MESLSETGKAAEHSHDHSHSHDHDHSHSHDHEHSHSHGEEEHCDDCGHAHAPGEHDHVHHTNIHDDSVTSASFVIEGEMDLQKLNMWLGALLEVRGEDIYRMKGILNIKFNKERFVFQVSICHCCICCLMNVISCMPECGTACDSHLLSVPVRNCMDLCVGAATADWCFSSSQEVHILTSQVISILVLCRVCTTCSRERQTANGRKVKSE